MIKIFAKREGHKMEETIKWNEAGISVRIAIVELCGWKNKSGNATPTGKQIAKTQWEKLTPAARRVLTGNGIESGHEQTGEETMIISKAYRSNNRCFAEYKGNSPDEL